MGREEVVIFGLKKLLLSSDFMGIDANGHSRGLVLGWLPSKIRILNSWALDSTIGTDIQIEGLGSDFRIVNIYGPYDTHVRISGSLFLRNLSFMRQSNIRGRSKFFIRGYGGVGTQCKA
jgi:hypothetical protein